MKRTRGAPHRKARAGWGEGNDAMFCDSLLESVPERRPRRFLATTISFLLQAAGVGVLLAVPLFYTGALPPVPASTGVVFASGGGDPGDSVAVTTATDDSTPSDSSAIEYLADGDVHRMATGPSGHGRHGSGPGGGSGEGPYTPGPDCAACPHLPPGMIPIPWRPPVLVPVKLDKPLQISHIDEGMLLVRVEPQYPVAARIAHVQGAVEIAAIISRDGRIEQLRLLRGSPLLVNAALGAVRQWRYRPYILNGQAVEVETLIVVNFRLGS